VALEALWPPPGSPTVGPGDGSTANEASVVLLAEVRGVRILLTGDVEPEGQAALARMLPGLRVDVLKVPHHGSRYQDEEWLLSLHAATAVVSVGADNDYGHPAPESLEPLEAAGTRVWRTDEDGDVAVVSEGDGGGVAVRARGS
jgi:competence protein ComEC